MATQKYRPYFTLAEIDEIINCLKSHPSPRRLQIAQYLTKFKIQAEFGLRESAYESKPSMMEKLGFSDTPVPLSHEITGEAAYNAWVASPTSCSPKTIQEALEWGYANGKLTPEQEADFESQMLKGI